MVCVTEESSVATNREYVHIYELHKDYLDEICPECGDRQWYKREVWDSGETRWRCLECRKMHYHHVQIECEQCLIRMVRDGGQWKCNHCGKTKPCQTDALVDRLTAEHDVRGYARGMMLTCPICDMNPNGERWTVRCDPDGTLICDECDVLYLGQYSDAWYAYAVWMEDKEEVTVYP